NLPRFLSLSPSLSLLSVFSVLKMTVEVVVSSLRTCLICTTPVTIPHYGIEACRACASFFKRAKLTGKKFVCRQGDRNCKIVKDERFMCRSCRYDRCVAHGMMYERASKETTEEKLKQKPSCDADSIGPSTSLEPEEKSILRRFGRLYNTSIERRRAQELQLLQDRSDIRLVLHPTQKIYSSNYSDSLRMYDIMLAETRPVYEKAFPAITKLREQDQDTLCKSYISKFCLIDNAHRTRKVWGEFKQFGMRSVLSAVDFTRLDLWLGEDQGGKNRDSLVSYLHDQIQIQCAILGPVLVRAQITTNEFHAILALLLCEIGSSKILQG
ncbi:hypothetical protein PFISCL1PPCAC_13692, partial [Pristionchus fissidentatus]